MYINIYKNSIYIYIYIYISTCIFVSLYMYIWDHSSALLYSGPLYSGPYTKLYIYIQDKYIKHLTIRCKRRLRDG